MPIQLPDLDTKSYKDLLDEALSSIPRYTKKWTNHNPSDPGITILELLSWICENTLYRGNRINEEAYINFLRLVAGASGQEDIDNLLKDQKLDPAHRKILEFLKDIEDGNLRQIPEMKAAAHKFLNSRYRAVTISDFRELAIMASQTYDAKVRRAIVRKPKNEEKVEIIIVSDERDKYDKLISIVEEYLSPRVLIGTIFEVKKPVYTGLAVNIKILCQSYAQAGKVTKNVRTRVENHLDPLTGGPQKDGWPYGRTVTVYEISQIVEETEGVKLADSVIFDNNENLKIKEVEGLIEPTVKIDVVEEK